MSIEMTAYVVNWNSLMEQVIRVNEVDTPVSEFLSQYHVMARGNVTEINSFLGDCSFSVGADKAKVSIKSGDATTMLAALITLRTKSKGDQFVPLFGCYEKWHTEGELSYTFFVECDGEFISEFQALPRRVAESFLSVRELTLGAMALLYLEFYENTRVGRGLALEGKTHNVLTSRALQATTILRLESITKALWCLVALVAAAVLILIF